MGGDMPLILDEIAVTEDLKLHGIQGAVVITVQRIRPTEHDGDNFPADVRDKSIGVISVYPRDAAVAPFYLNAKQTFEYVGHPQGHTIDIYGLTRRGEVRCTELSGGRLHIMRHRGKRMLSIGHFELNHLRRYIDSVHTDFPEFFT